MNYYVNVYLNPAKAPAGTPAALSDVAKALIDMEVKMSQPVIAFKFSCKEALTLDEENSLSVLVKAALDRRKVKYADVWLAFKGDE